MKLKTIFLAIMAAAFSFVACNQEEDPNDHPASVVVTPTELNFGEGEGSSPVTLTATRNWYASTTADWVKVDIKEGDASLQPKTVSVSVLANAEFNREAEVVFSIGLAKARVKVTQTGPKGEYTTPTISVAEFIAKADTQTEYRLAGKVSGFSKGTNSSGKNYMQFNLTDDSGSILVYGFKDGQVEEWSTKLKNGGNVVVDGTYEFYSQKSQHEVVKATVVSFEEKAVVATESTVANFIEKADGNYYRLTGKVSSFQIKDATKKYMQFYLTDATGSIMAYGFNDGEFDKWSGKLKNNGTVVLTGTYYKYTSNNGSVTHEIENITIESFEEGQDTSNPKGTGTLEDPFNIDGAIKAVKDAGDKDTAQEYHVKGKIATIKYEFSADPGTAQFTISDDGAATSTLFTCYSVYFLENKAWAEGNTQIKVGDEVIVKGIFTVYNGTYETKSKKAFIYSLNGKTSEEAGPSFGVKNAAISVGATATEATVSVTGNVAWTATATEGATLDAASGEGAKDIKVTFAANTDTENAKTYKVTLTTTAEVATKSIEVTITQGKASSGGGTSYVLDGDAIKAAHTESWTYSSGEKNVTATDGSVWTLFNTFASANQVTVQMNKGKSAYVLTPTLPSGMEIKKIAVVLNTKNDGSGNMGDRPMDILNADGSATLLDNVTGQNLADGLDVAAGNSQVRIICDETNGGAVYITSITVTYGAAQ